MPVNVIVGLQRGDEGKGRFVDMMAEDHDIVARFNGGNNAGHTVVLPDGRELALHMVPSGIAHPHVMNVIGNGTLVNPVKLIEEIADIEAQDIEVSRRNLLISSAAHLLMPHHICEDEIKEAGPASQGSTLSGISNVVGSKVLHENFRVEDIINDTDRLAMQVYENLRALRPRRLAAGLEQLDEKTIAKEYLFCAKQLVSHVIDAPWYLNEQLLKEKPARLLAEGAQAFWLDIDQGMYPFVTSSTTTSGGVSPGLGIAPQYIDHVTGVVKAVQSHVGGGPFVTEVTEPKLLAQLHGDKTTVDAEFGTTTGRERKLGFLDLPQIRRAAMINGAGSLALSKLDWFPRYGKQALICTSYAWQGKTHNIAPASAHDLEQCQPVYESFPTWEENIQNVRDFNRLPSEAKQVVEFLEAETGVPINMIGVGPQRDQVILR